MAGQTFFHPLADLVVQPVIEIGDHERGPITSDEAPLEPEQQKLMRRRPMSTTSQSREGMVLWGGQGGQGKFVIRRRAEGGWGMAEVWEKPRDCVAGFAGYYSQPDRPYSHGFHAQHVCRQCVRQPGRCGRMEV